MPYKIKRTKQKRKEFIYIDETPKGNYMVMFEDETGYSTLAKTKTLKEAKKFERKFKKDLKEGKLLHEDKSAFGRL